MRASPRARRRLPDPRLGCWSAGSTRSSSRVRHSASSNVLGQAAMAEAGIERPAADVVDELRQLGPRSRAPCPWRHDAAQHLVRAAAQREQRRVQPRGGQQPRSRRRSATAASTRSSRSAASSTESCSKRVPRSLTSAARFAASRPSASAARHRYRQLTQRASSARSGRRPPRRSVVGVPPPSARISAEEQRGGGQDPFRPAALEAQLARSPDASRRRSRRARRRRGRTRRRTPPR